MSSTNTVKGALLYSGSQHIPPAPFVFQFNPATITHRKNYPNTATQVDEIIRFQLVLNAMEGMEQQDPVMTEHGIYPQIAALEEILSYQTQLQPASWLRILFRSRPARFLMWVYGERIIPVMLQRMTIRETMHNSTLKPIHAEVDISLRVLTSKDLGHNKEGLKILNNYHQQRKQKSELLKALTNVPLNSIR